ncbi:TetR/AcrR family transcriptional regulator [Streptomyces sp. SID5789]|uniref:TetR/AcrR family transcriptional regulator n=1 Tax=Streptomyces sp. SID5789 TaxID=2690310 RepID=UPI001371117C|nr:TetR/AcrR family transcriptional regulator [Streptomyces sp. SID5789]MZE70916.1 TetR family transcriptional regulator [Streptomyces sp. SID5789]
MASGGSRTRTPARERLLQAANELFYGEGVQIVGIDRVIEHAGVAKASLYNTFGSKEGLVCAYLELRDQRSRDRITRTLTRFRSPREQLLGVFDAQGEAFTDPAYNGCAFVRATAEAPENSSVRRAAEKYRAWILGLFTELADASGYAEPEELARRLRLLYDGAEQAARMDRDPSAATTARNAAAALLGAAPLRETRHLDPVT